MLREGTYVGQRVRQIAIGQRRKGRPKRWEDCVKEDMKEIREKEEDAQDRRLWRNLIRTGDPSNGN